MHVQASLQEVLLTVKSNATIKSVREAGAIWSPSIMLLGLALRGGVADGGSEWVVFRPWWRTWASPSCCGRVAWCSPLARTVPSPLSRPLRDRALLASEAKCWAHDVLMRITRSSTAVVRCWSWGSPVSGAGPSTA